MAEGDWVALDPERNVIPIGSIVSVKLSEDSLWLPGILQPHASASNLSEPFFVKLFRPPLSELNINNDVLVSSQQLSFFKNEEVDGHAMSEELFSRLLIAREQLSINPSIKDKKYKLRPEGTWVGCAHVKQGRAGAVNSKGLVVLVGDVFKVKNRTFWAEGFFEEDKTKVVAGLSCVENASNVFVETKAAETCMFDINEIESVVLTVEAGTKRPKRRNVDVSKLSLPVQRPDPGPPAKKRRTTRIEKTQKRELFLQELAPPGQVCELCSRSDNYMGPLLVYSVSSERKKYFVHLFCIRFSSGVRLAVDVNAVSAIQKSKKMMCEECGKSGATLGCLNKRHSKGYHAICVRDNGWTRCIKALNFCNLPEDSSNPTRLPRDLYAAQVPKGRTADLGFIVSYTVQEAGSEIIVLWDHGKFESVSVQVAKTLFSRDGSPYSLSEDDFRNGSMNAKVGDRVFRLKDSGNFPSRVSVASDGEGHVQTVLVSECDVQNVESFGLDDEESDFHGFGWREDDNSIQPTSTGSEAIPSRLTDLQASRRASTEHKIDTGRSLASRSRSSLLEFEELLAEEKATMAREWTRVNTRVTSLYETFQTETQILRDTIERLQRRQVGFLERVQSAMKQMQER